MSKIKELLHEMYHQFAPMADDADFPIVLYTPDGRVTKASFNEMTKFKDLQEKLDTISVYIEMLEEENNELKEEVAVLEWEVNP
jgi:hypothetical protein